MTVSERPAAWQTWLGILALAMAVISLSAFGVEMAIAGPWPKSIVYGSNLIFALYTMAPTISVLSGVVAVLVAVVALSRRPQALLLALVSAAAAVLLFFFLTIMTANVMTTTSPPLLDANGGPSGRFPMFALTPPLIGLSGVVVAVLALLTRLRRFAGLRGAIAALILGGTATAYWAFALVILSLNGE